MAFKRPDGERIFFIEAFAKNEKANISDKELEALGIVSNAYIHATDLVIDKLISNGKIFEIKEIDTNE